MASAGQFDVVVVGGGISGLSVARALTKKRVLVLERTARLGGRVLTLERAWGAVDLGACFAFNSDLLPPGSLPPNGRCEERGPLGALLHGELVFDASARGLLEKSALGDRSALEGALFHQIHPGKLSDYSAERRADALIDWYPDHWLAGNGALVRAHAEGLAAAVWLDTHVRQLSESHAGVAVHLAREGSASEVSARAVVVATPADAARDLVSPRTQAAREFLESVRYGRYTVVAFELENLLLSPDFRFILTPGLDVTLVMQQSSPDRRHRALLCYYDDAASDRVAHLADEALVAATRRELLPLSRTGLELTNAPATVQRWKLSGTVLDDERRARYRSEHARATPRIFLAGDYLASTPGWGYGLDDAVSAGRHAAALVNQLWDADL